MPTPNPIFTLAEFKSLANLSSASDDIDQTRLDSYLTVVTNVWVESILVLNSITWDTLTTNQQNALKASAVFYTMESIATNPTMRGNTSLGGALIGLIKQSKEFFNSKKTEFLDLAGLVEHSLYSGSIENEIE